MPRSYKCAVCGAVLKLVHNYKAHMQLHAADMSYQCEACYLCFSHPNDLARHMRTHTGESPYRFDSRCDLPFARLRNIQWHRFHDKKTPFGFVAVHRQTEPVGMVTVTTQTRRSSGYTTTISTVTSEIGSAYVVTNHNRSATTTTAIQGSGLLTTNTDLNFLSSFPGNLEEISDLYEPRYDYNTDDSSDDIDVVN